MRLVFGFIIIICSLLMGCKPSRPSGVLSEHRMVPILVDYHLAQGMAEGRDNETKNRYANVQAVFRKHHITERQFDVCMLYYCEHANKLKKIYEEVNRRIELASASMGLDVQRKVNYHEMSAQGDTANIWGFDKMILLKPNYLQNIYSFTLDADSNFLCGDRFMWTFKPRTVTSSKRPDAFVQLLIRFQNDSVASNACLLTYNDEFSIRVQPSRKQDTLSIVSVQGFVYVPQNVGEEQKLQLLMLNDIALIRYHDPYTRKANSSRDTLSIHTSLADTLVQDSVLILSTQDSTKIKLDNQPKSSDNLSQDESAKYRLKPAPKAPAQTSDVH